MFKNLLALVTAVAAVATLGAQQPPAPAATGWSAATRSAAAGRSAASRPANSRRSSRPVFKAGTNQVRVDVTVLDRKGDPVNDLTKDDFEVREDGVPQSVDTLKLVEANGEAPADDTVARRSGRRSTRRSRPRATTSGCS